MLAHWFYVAGSICFLIGTILNMTATECEDDEPTEPWGFNVKDGGVVDGGESEWEGEY